MAVLNQYDWIFALITLAFFGSAFGNGANDVANSYATSVAARTLTMLQVGFLAVITEFVGAIALGARVTDTIKNDIIGIDKFSEARNPGTLMLGMLCAEVGNATWLLIATKFGFPVSTTQTIVGALIGVGIASQTSIAWSWEKGSVSQVAASWGVSPLIAAGFAAIIFGTIKYTVLVRRDSLRWALRLIPAYLSVTAAILALFIVVEAPTAPSLEDFGAGKAAGIIVGVFVGVLVIAYGFFLPYFHRRLIKQDYRLEWYHIPLGPTLWKDDPYIYFPSKKKHAVIDYYSNAYIKDIDAMDSSSADSSEERLPRTSDQQDQTSKEVDVPDVEKADQGRQLTHKTAKITTPEQRFLAPTAHLSIAHPARLWSWTKFILLRGVTTDVVSHASADLQAKHSRAPRYDNRVEHLWTYAQVASAMLMSIAHGSNDVANAVGPWAATYSTWRAGFVDTESATPAWMLAVAGILLGLGFWFFGYHIMRSLGNRITQHSPTRGFSMELGAAITVLLASRLGLPVSTTQCLTGATLGVALMNYDLKTVNWWHLLKIFGGWVLTLPCAGLVSGLLMGITLNTPHF